MQNKILVCLFLLILSACERQGSADNFYTSELFRDVQIQAIFPDSKTFPDCTPKKDLEEILELYSDTKSDPDFDLRQFVLDNFEYPKRPVSTFTADTTITLEQHLTALWQVLTRTPDEQEKNSSLIPLPHPYLVPGGRFSEIYYWDSYFTMLGLKAQKRYGLMVDMINNFAFLIDTIGFIPNGNRNYYLGRSQPPFFALMVKELETYDSLAARRYLSAMEKEYNFWMKGSDQLLKPGDAVGRTVMVSDGVFLNRYWDNHSGPRPEAFKEDVAVAGNSQREKEDIFRNIRAAAESGWDFSTRWFEESAKIESIQTTAFVPVDLNSLMFHLEVMIARGNELNGDHRKAEEFRRRSDQRRRAILTFCWDPQQKFFFDYNFKKSSTSKVKSLAGVYPLFFGVATPDMAASVAETLEKNFLMPGGLVTTLTVSGEQWDSPNGWAPLQWMACQGLKNYQQHELAEEIEKCWIRQNIRVFKHTGKMMEKYNVMDTTLAAGGGEYPNQDGFGWTNGVALAFMLDN